VSIPRATARGSVTNWLEPFAPCPSTFERAAHAFAGEGARAPSNKVANPTDGHRTNPLLATSNFSLLLLVFKKLPIVERSFPGMKKQYAVSLFLASLLIIAFAAIAGSGRNNDLPAAPAIGSTIEDFKLPDANGTEHSLKSLTGKNGAVLIFIATRCPVSNAYNDRMEALAQDYKAKGINVIGINSNVTEPASEVKSHATDKHLTFTILKDDGNKIADRFGATKTPEAYVIDANNKLLYHGRIDNAQNTANITANDLRDALNELIAGKQVSKTGGAAFGCSIKRAS
jgi:peroxiredoxin